MEPEGGIIRICGIAEVTGLVSTSRRVENIVKMIVINASFAPGHHTLQQMKAAILGRIALITTLAGA